MTDSTTATAEERLAAVERFAQHVDWPDLPEPDSYGLGYRDGYIAHHRELRALLGIGEGP